MLNRAGIEQLKADLRANAKHYTQNKFGMITSECGTECCIAGLCLRRNIGEEAFSAMVRKNPYGEDFVNACISAGVARLGIIVLEDEDYEAINAERGLDEDAMVPIFSTTEFWPEYLRERYDEAADKHDHKAMAEVACSALDLIDENGVFPLELYEV